MQHKEPPPRLVIVCQSEYRYGRRGVLVAGDRFRVRGGPVYITDSGRKVPMYERGEFRFVRYCVRGSSKWIEACRDGGGTAVLWVGKCCRSKAEPNFLRRPYRIIRRTAGGKERRHRGRPNSSPEKGGAN